MLELEGVVEVGVMVEFCLARLASGEEGGEGERDVRNFSLRGAVWRAASCWMRFVSGDVREGEEEWYGDGENLWFWRAAICCRRFVSGEVREGEGEEEGAELRDLSLFGVFSFSFLPSFSSPLAMSRSVDFCEVPCGSVRSEWYW